MNTVFSVTSKSLIALSMTILIVLAGAMGYARWQGIRFLSIQTDSMQPTIAIGDLVIINPLKASQEVIVGDIINFNSVTYSNTTITHRVVGIDKRTKLITARGDASTQNDPPMTIRAVNGTVTRAIPQAGYMFDYMKNPIGLIAAVYIPGIILATGEIKRLMYHYGSMRYHLYR